jgi:hypothetical protein
MAVAMVYPEPEKTTHGKKSKTKLLLETKTNFSGARLSQGRTVLAHSTDLARASGSTSLLSTILVHDGADGKRCTASPSQIRT